MSAPTMPKQQVGLLGAIAIGLASMLGAGIFTVFGPAFAKTYSYLLVALVLAALVACLNAASVYSLAKQVDRPGGVYAYSRAYLNSDFSFIAGFSFVFGKIGSIGAIGWIFGEYVSVLAPGKATSSITATIAILALTLLNALGINRTALVAAILATLTTSYLLVAGILGAAHHGDGEAFLNIFSGGERGGILAAASLLFFAFAGYARVATLGNEVKNAKLNIPRAILISLWGVLALYMLLAYALVNTLGAELDHATAPFINMLHGSGNLIPEGVTVFVATAASLGSMLALLAGVSRTAATMAEDRELPRAFAHRNRFGAPWLAEVIIAAGSIALIWSTGALQWVIGFSSFSVLLYYAIGHLSALRQPRAEHPQPRIVPILGFVLCVTLLLSVPGPAVGVSCGILLAAYVLRRMTRGLANTPRAE
ncbi:MAG: amino acid permease [Phenylobacterium zucineum]|nr:MAG: amino acid permease [Phenylobacterium zucineum]